MTAYLKAHYPVEFMAALLSSDIPGRNFKKKDSLVEHLEDCQRMGIEVLPPDVNRSGVEFAVADGQDSASPCRPSRAAAARRPRPSSAARQAGGPYRSLFDFCERLDPGAVNRTAIESLVKAGAFDCLGGRRGAMVRRHRPGHAGRGRRRRRPPQRPEGPVRRRRGRTGRRGRRPTCPTCPNGTTATAWPRRRKSSASTCPAIRWPSTRRRWPPTARTPPPRRPP